MRAQTEQMERLASWVERSRYGGHEVAGLRTVEEIDAMARAIEQGLMAALSPRDRRRAVRWPRSGRQALTGGWTALGEGVGQTEVARGARAVRGSFSGRRRGDAPSALRSGS